jgi:copper resistance protein C
MKQFTRLLSGTALAAAMALVAVQQVASATPAPTVARFHLALSKAEPAVNDTVAASPKHIKLWFTQEVKAAVTAVQIMGADKHVVPTGPLTIDAAPKSPAVAEIKETLKPGKYTVEWKTLAADGHPNKGTFAFTVGAKAAN